MTLPASWTLITVTGTYVKRDGSPATGHVSFTSPQVVVIDDVIVVPKRITARLDNDGHFSIQLPSTNDPDLNVTGWTYTVTEHIANARAEYAIEVPYNSSGIDLATVVPAVPAEAVVSYLRVSDLGATVARQSDLDAHEANVSNPHAVTKAQVGLGSVDNTADASKPVSAAQAAAIATAVSNHEAAGNPHPVYLTAAEGNAAYDALGAATAAVAAHEAASDPHPAYLKQAEGDALYDALGAAAAAQAAAAADATSKADAKVEDAINDGVTNKAPSENAVYDALALKSPLASPNFTGPIQTQSRVAKYDLAAGYTLLYPTQETQIGFRFQITAGAATPVWYKLAELVTVNAADTSVVYYGTMVASANATSPSQATAVYQGGIRVTAGNVFGAATNQHAGGPYANTVYLRVYRDTDGSGHNRLTLYLYDSQGTFDRLVTGMLSFIAGHSDDVINVWQTSAGATTTDPAGTMTEVVRTFSIGASQQTPDARKFINTAGSAVDPAALTTVVDSNTAINLTAAHHMQRIRCTAATTATITVNTGIIFDGFYCEIVQAGAGQVVIAAGGGMTQECAGTAKSRTAFSPLSIDGRSTTAYYVTGDMSAT